jgi:hypothetical protein
MASRNDKATILAELTIWPVTLAICEQSVVLREAARLSWAAQENGPQA